PYNCTIHASMTGTITVQAVASDGFINSGLNDAWGDPTIDKQGFFITVFPDIKKIFLSWFTYDLQRPANGVTAMLGEPGHRWLTALGTYTGDRATLAIELTQGGIFDANPPDPTQSPYGTIELLVNNCNQIELLYEIPSLGLSRLMFVERTYASPDNVALCESLRSPSP
ncbi:MAG: cupredoxin domain-containing protein, partial [Lysobacterales bacterium]